MFSVPLVPLPSWQDMPLSPFFFPCSGIVSFWSAFFGEGAPRFIRRISKYLFPPTEAPPDLQRRSPFRPFTMAAEPACYPGLADLRCFPQTDADVLMSPFVLMPRRIFPCQPSGLFLLPGFGYTRGFCLFLSFQGPVFFAFTRIPSVFFPPGRSLVPDYTISKTLSPKDNRSASHSIPFLFSPLQPSPLSSSDALFSLPFQLLFSFRPQPPLTRHPVIVKTDFSLLDESFFARHQNPLGCAFVLSPALQSLLPSRSPKHSIMIRSDWFLQDQIFSLHSCLPNAEILSFFFTAQRNFSTPLFSPLFFFCHVNLCAESRP